MKASLKLTIVASLAICSALVSISRTACAAPGGPSPARSAAVDASKFFPESEIKYGQTGYALTVFHGTKIERFGVKMLGVLKRVNNGKDLILFRATSGPSLTRDAMIVAGMSGSPVYVHGRIVGAIAYGLPFAREPMGLITPIADMLDSLDPRLPSRPDLSDSQAVRGLAAKGVSVSADEIAPYVSARDAGLSHGALMFEPMMTPIAVSGVSPDGIARLGEALAPYRLMPVAGGGSGEETLSPAEQAKAAESLQPGAAVGVSLAQGDIDLTAIGTLTYRDGNKIVAFGHPFTGMGPMDAALTTASITDVFPSYEESTKLGMPLATVGSVFQDRPFSVGGVVGSRPRMIPVHVSIDDETDRRKCRFNARVLDHPLLTGLLALTVVNEAIVEAHGSPGDAVAYVTTDVDADKVGHIVRSNVFFDAFAINDSATGDLNGIVNMLEANPFYQVGVKSVDVSVRIEDLHATAQIDHIVLPRATYAPGDTVNVGVVVRPYKQDPVVRTVPLTIPQNAPDGPVTLYVRGGATTFSAEQSMQPNGAVTVRSQSSPDSDQAPPTNIAQLVSQFLKQPKNDELVASLTLPSSAPEISGEKLAQLPPNMMAIMRSEHASGQHFAGEVIKKIAAMPWIVSGLQAITLEIRDKENYDTSTVAPPGSAPPSGPGSAPGSPSTNNGAVPPIVSTIDEYPNADSDDSSAIPSGFAAAENNKSIGANPSTRGAAASAPAVAPPPPPAPEDGNNPPPIGPGASAEAAAGPNPIPVARLASIWRENTAESFSNGTFDSTSVTDAPDIRLTPAIAKIASTSAAQVWCEAFDPSGNLYLGTGNDGAIYKIAKGAREAELFARTSQLEVTALALDPVDGALLAATAPRGAVYRISSSGKATVFAQVSDPYVTAMLVDRDRKTLYFATAGGTGRIYAASLSGAPQTAPRLVFTSPDVHLLCLAQAPDGKLYAGGDPNGVVYQVDPNGDAGRARVVYDSPGPTVSAVAVDSKNRLYVGNAPAGAIARIDLNKLNPDSAPQIAKSIVAKTADFVSGMTVDSFGDVWATAGDTIYRVTPGYDVPTSKADSDDDARDVVTAFPSDPKVTYACIAASPAGVAAGAAGIATVYGFRGGAPGSNATGTYTSAIYDARLKSRWGTISWDALTPAGSSVALETRSGDVAKPDSTWSDWSAPQADQWISAGGATTADSAGGPTTTAATGYRITSPAARFLQYRAVFTQSSTASAAAPALSRVDVYYMPENRPPSVHILAPEGGDAVSGDVSLRWVGTDPDHDTLDYKLYSSTDDGATWSRIDTGALRERSAPAPASGNAPASTSQSVSSLARDLARHPEIPAAVKDKMLKDAQAAAANSPASAVAAPAADSATEPPTLRAQTFTWSTKQQPDGVYRLKVVASDEPSNAVGFLTAEAISEPFAIVNTPPVIELDPVPPTDAATGEVTISGIVTATRVFVQAVQYKIDDGGWMAAAPVGGMFDSAVARFKFAARPNSAGPHKITIEAYDRAGNIATKTLDVK
jgi:hypothetical protein